MAELVLDDALDADGTASSESDKTEEVRWRILNLSVLPVWVAMIIAPDSKFTERLVRASSWWLAGYSAVYVAGLAATARSSPPPVSSAAVRTGMFSDARLFHTGWVHYLAFDLFVGRWIWRQAREEGRSSRLALVATLLAGPAGLGIFGLQRGSLSPELRPIRPRRAC